ncbi:MAG TPA: MBL fold metallo-hydrolase [Tepidisphaeraceae bacterium]|jgi:glyoxylase-like metal-dependent hydrolase (beta-lactamase superfamily II)|nr:MBL fold metallo-hydrolase [Tepidisphaeraceae bacterium]
MKVLMHTGGMAVTNCFLVADENTKQAVLFDAPDHTVAPLLDEVAKNGWDLIGLWLTHGHFDHVADHALVTERFPTAKVLIHPLDEPKLLRPGASFFTLPFEIAARKADGYVEDGQELAIGAIAVRVMFTPGHAPGHVSYYLPAENLLIGGDLIIGGAVGRTDLPDSNFADLVKSVGRVMALPPDTRLMPGHGEPATLAEERQTNDYVNMLLERGAP